MISITCEHCDKPLRIRDELAGKRVKCPGCGGVIAIPSLADEDEPPPPKKKVKTRVVSEEDEDTRSNEEGPTKPNPLFFFVGLGMALVGLVLMALFIYFSVMAGRDADNKQVKLQQLREDQSKNPDASADHKANLKKAIDATVAEQSGDRSRSSRNMMLAVFFGIIFVAGAVLRGYHHLQMKKWNLSRVGSSKKKKKKRRDEDDE